MKTISVDDLRNNYNSLGIKDCFNNGGSIYINKEDECIGLKLCKYTSYEKLEYFKTLSDYGGITYPIEIFKTNILKYASAYTMLFYKDAKTFKQIINQGIYIDGEEKKKIILQLFKTITTYHRYFVFGDIHLDNLLVINNDGGYYSLVCDWDVYRKLNEELFIISPYYIGNNYLVQTRYSDIVKLVISSLAFYLDKNLEKYLIKNPIGFIEVFNKLEYDYPSLGSILTELKTEFYNQKRVSNLNYDLFIESLPKQEELQRKRGLNNPFL